MYLNQHDKLVFSPSDLVLAMRSPFASWMERFALESPDSVADIETDDDPMMALLAAKGNPILQGGDESVSANSRLLLSYLLCYFGIEDNAINGNGD